MGRARGVVLTYPGIMLLPSCSLCQQPWCPNAKAVRCAAVARPGTKHRPPWRPRSTSKRRTNAGRPQIGFAKARTLGAEIHLQHIWKRKEVHRRLNEKDAEAIPSTTSLHDVEGQLQLQPKIETDPQVERSHCIHAEKIRCHAENSGVTLAICTWL